jgi:hypothetical protein
VAVAAPPNGLAVQLRPTALTINAGARRPPPERYHRSIGTSCWASAATACWAAHSQPTYPQMPMRGELTTGK